MSFWVAVLLGIVLLAIAANWQAIVLVGGVLLVMAAFFFAVGGLIWVLVNHSDVIGGVLMWGFGIVLGLVLLVGLPALVITTAREQRTQRELAARRAVETGETPAPSTRRGKPAGRPSGEVLVQGPLVVETAAEAKRRREGPSFAELRKLTAADWEQLSKDTTWPPLDERLSVGQYYELMKLWYPGFRPFHEIAAEFVEQRGWSVSWGGMPDGHDLRFVVSDDPATAMVAWSGTFEFDFEGQRFFNISDPDRPVLAPLPVEPRVANQIAMPTWSPETTSTGRFKNKKSERCYTAALQKVQDDRDALLVLLQATGMTGSARPDYSAGSVFDTARVLERPAAASKRAPAGGA